jgi:hypothetical protein
MCEFWRKCPYYGEKLVNFEGKYANFGVKRANFGEIPKISKKIL